MYERRLVSALRISVLYRPTALPALLTHVHGQWCPARLTWQRRVGGRNRSDLAVSCPRRGHPGTSLSVHTCTSAPVNSRLSPHGGRGKPNHCREMWAYTKKMDMTLKRLMQKHIVPSADCCKTPGKMTEQEVLFL